jgi:hypothetical protein
MLYCRAYPEQVVITQPVKKFLALMKFRSSSLFIETHHRNPSSAHWTQTIFFTKYITKIILMLFYHPHTSLQSWFPCGFLIHPSWFNYLTILGESIVWHISQIILYDWHFYPEERSRFLWTIIPVYQTTQHHIPEKHNLNYTAIFGPIFMNSPKLAFCKCI